VKKILFPLFLKALKIGVKANSTMFGPKKNIGSFTIQWADIFANLARKRKYGFSRATPIIGNYLFSFL
jgi:hypothetical protein